MGVLQHDAQRTAQVVLADVLHVDAVKCDLAGRDVVKAVDEVGDRRFACAGRADKGDFLPGLGVEADAVQNRAALVVAEADVAEAHVAAQRLQRAVRLLPGPAAGLFAAGGQHAVLFAHIDQADLAFVRFRVQAHGLEDALGARHAGSCSAG